MTRQDELWKEDTGGTIRCHHCDWAGQADTIAEALAGVRQHQAAAHPLEPLRPYVAKLLEIAEALADDVRYYDPTADVNVNLDALAQWKQQYEGPRGV